MTFQPRINPTSKSIINNSRFGSNKGENSIFDVLYEDAFKPKKEEIESKMSNVIDNKRVNDFVERMQHSVQKKREKERNQIFYSQMLDLQSDTPLFKPTICRPPKFEVPFKLLNKRNVDRLPIGDYLYSQKKEYPEGKSEIGTASQIHSINKSTEIFENLKKKRIRAIFDTLDLEGDGQISATRLNISSVEPEILELIAPLLIEMEQDNLVLKFEDFENACSKLLKELPVSDRNKLLGLHKKKEAPIDYTFKPKINENSIWLSENRRNNEDNSHLYHKAIESQRNTEFRAEQIRRIRDENELRECTFHPKI